MRATPARTGRCKPTGIVAPRPAKMQAAIAQRRHTREAAMGSARSAGGSGTRGAGLEGELQVMDFTEFVVHLQQRLDHRFDLDGHAVELLEGDPLDFAAHLLIEAEKAPQPPW